MGGDNWTNFLGDGIDSNLANSDPYPPGMFSLGGTSSQGPNPNYFTLGDNSGYPQQYLDDFNIGSGYQLPDGSYNLPSPEGLPATLFGPDGSMAGGPGGGGGFGKGLADFLGGALKGILPGLSAAGRAAQAGLAYHPPPFTGFPHQFADTPRLAAGVTQPLQFGGEFRGGDNPIARYEAILRSIR